jgi:hypothetical protein
LELPSNNRWRRHHRAAEIPQIGQSAALLGLDAHDKSYAQRVVVIMIIMVTRALVRFVRMLTSGRSHTAVALGAARFSRTAT